MEDKAGDEEERDDEENDATWPGDFNSDNHLDEPLSSLKQKGS